MSGGGKGGSNQTVAYYYAPVAFAICEGPIIGIKQIWAGGNLIFSDGEPVAVNTYQGGGKKSGPTVSTSYQTFTSSTQNDIQTGGSALGPWTCYLGTETQPADPTIGEGVAYRGVAYIVFPALNLGPGATIPPLTFEVVTVGSLNPPSVEFSYSPSFDGYIDVNQGFSFDGCGNPIVCIGAASGQPMWLKCSATARAVEGIGPVLSARGLAPITNEIAFRYPFRNGLGSQLFAWMGASFSEENETYLGVIDPDTNSYEIVPLSGQPGGTVFFSDGNLVATIGTNVAAWSLPDYGAVFSEALLYYYVAGTGTILNGAVFAPGGGYLVKYDASGTTAFSLNASCCVSDGTNLWVSYKDSSGALWIAQVNNGGTILSQFSVSSAFTSLLLVGGFIWANTGGELYQYSLTGTLTNTLGVPNGSGPMAFDGMYIWTNYAGYLTKVNPGGNTIIAGTMDLPAAVTILCERAGIAQFDVSQLPAIPVNFVRGDTVTARSMLQRLSQAYFFSMVDSGGVLRFVPQGQPSQAVIPLEDLGFDKISANAQTPYTGSRISGVDLPRSVKIRYISPALNWEKYEQVFALESYESGKEITLDLPLILDDQTAYNIAALACTLPHAERMQYSFTTSYKWLALEPGDVVTLPFGTCRILTVKMGQKNGIPVIDFTACIDGMNANAGAGYATPALPNYQPNTGGITALLAAPANMAPAHTPGSATPHPIATAPQMVQTVPNAGVAKMVLVEPPPLKSTDTGMRFMTGAYSTGNTFPGAAIFQSTDGGNTYSQLSTEISATDAGYANTVLPSPTGPYNNNNSYTWDNFSTVDVYLLGNGGDLTPAPDLNVMNGANGAMLGSELIQYANATLMTDSLGNPFYRLSRLLRGRKGTEWAMGTHQVGEPFYAIPSALSKEPYTPPMLNNAYLYKVVMMGGDLGNAPAVSYEPNGNSLRQWAVCHPAVSLDGSNDWTVSWTPRARYNGDFASGYIPTLDSDTAGWSIDVFNGATLKRTISVPLQQTAPWQSIYTAAMQAADGFSPGQSGITFNLYQLSSQVGRGTVRSITTP